MRSRALLWARYHDDLRRRGCSLRTIQAYRHSLFSLWATLHKDPLKIVDQDVYRWLDRPANPRSRARGRVLSAATRAKYASDACVFYDWAWRVGLTKTNRLAALIRPRSPRRTIPRRVEDDLIERLFDRAAWRRTDQRVKVGRGRWRIIRGDPRLEVMVSLGYFGGMRIGEVARLRVEEVWLNARHSRMLVHGKGNKDRIVPVNQALAGILRSWLADLPTSGPVIGRMDNPGQALTPKHLGQLVRDLMHEAGIDDSSHALRHTFAYKALEGDEGRNIHAVGWLLGHDRLSTTQLYTLGYNADGERAVNLVPDPRPTHGKRRRSGPAAGQGSRA